MAYLKADLDLVIGLVQSDRQSYYITTDRFYRYVKSFGKPVAFPDLGRARTSIERFICLVKEESIQEQLIPAQRTVWQGWWKPALRPRTPYEREFVDVLCGSGATRRKADQKKRTKAKMVATLKVIEVEPVKMTETHALVQIE